MASIWSATTAARGACWARQRAGTSSAAASIVRVIGVFISAIRGSLAVGRYWTLVPFLLVAALARGQAVTSLDAELKPWTGDFDGMLENRTVRVLVPYSRTLYFNDKGAQRGLVADGIKDFEIYLNKKY